MAKRRTAVSVQMLLRRFGDAEMGDPDAMELVGLHDELARIERKWVMQIAQGSERRQPGDPKKLDLWYERLQRLIERAMRIGKVDPAIEPLLLAALAKCASRPKSSTE